MDTPYYTTRRTLQGRWAVVHMLPGLHVPTIDVDCPTLAAAEREAAWLNAERDRELQRAAQERALCGLRDHMGA